MRRRHRRSQIVPELDITAFLNLMIVLVPVLLLSMVFTQVRAIALDFPDQGARADATETESLQLRVTLSGDDMLLADNREGLIDHIEGGPEGPNYKALTEALKRIKYTVPDKRDISLLVSPGTRYQQLVSAMDAIRSYPAVVAASVVPAELFPDIALGDAPAPADVTREVQ